MSGGTTACTGGQLEGMWKESAVACIPTLREMGEGRYEISDWYLNLGPPQYEVRKPPIGFATVSSDVMTNTQTVHLIIFIYRSQHSGNYMYHLPQHTFSAFPSHCVFVFPMISQKTAVTSLNLIYWLAFVMETDCSL
jgi:hypothetical protein